MRISGPWSDAVTTLDYIREDDLNPNVAHDLEIMQSYWKGKEVGASVPQVYTHEEERAISINYLKNRSAIMEKPFIKVTPRKARRKGVFRFILPALGACF